MQTDKPTKREFKRSTKKKGRKFIQITATQGRLYALDQAGNIWEFSYMNKWFLLKAERVWGPNTTTLP